VDPTRCLVVEDAPAGLEAGRAAGARVVAVATTLPAAALDSWDWVPDLAALIASRDNTEGSRLRVTIA
jgi:sugar-phosphatase